MISSKRTSRLFLFVFIFVCSQAWSFGKSALPPGPEAIAHTAEVIETMNSAGYTYIQVEEKGIRFWIAIPETPVMVGQTISFYEQMLMENFTSQSLNRTFDRILFVEGIRPGKQLPTRVSRMTSPHTQAAQPDVMQGPGKLDAPAGRFSIREIFEKKDGLQGKVIEIKGQISKISRMIMGTNWVHIKDGSGSQAENNDKIIFRTLQDGVSIGDDVVARGILRVNKDFGAGYFYRVIVENAEITK